MSSNQHYVPQFYLRFFSKDKKSLCLLERRNGRIATRGSIKGQASKKGFYGDERVESALSELEGVFSGLLRRIVDEGNLDWLGDTEHLLLLQNLMLQRARTVSARAKHKEWNDMMVRLQMEIGINNDDKLTEEEKQRFRKELEHIEANPVRFQLEGMQVALENAGSLADLRPLLLVNRTNRPFFTCDAPVVLTNPHMRLIKIRGVLGTQTPGLLLLFPVNPEYCLMLIDVHCYTVKGVRGSKLPLRNLKDVLVLNKLQLHHSSSVIYFHDYHLSNYASEIWRSEKTKLVDHTGKVNQAPGIDESGTAMGDIIHSYEDQLPLVPSFTFLKYSSITENEYVFSTREERTSS